MKLTSAQIERTLSQFEAQAIPESHPVLTRLNELFGDHTFFIDSDGLSIVEPIDPTYPPLRRRAHPVVGLSSHAQSCAQSWNSVLPRTNHNRENAGLCVGPPVAEPVKRAYGEPIAIGKHVRR